MWLSDYFLGTWTKPDGKELKITEYDYSNEAFGCFHLGLLRNQTKHIIKEYARVKGKVMEAAPQCLPRSAHDTQSSYKNNHIFCIPFLALCQPLLEVFLHHGNCYHGDYQHHHWWSLHLPNIIPSVWAFTVTHLWGRRICLVTSVNSLGEHKVE